MSSALFLGLELATDQLRASLVDQTLELVGSECVDFDSELPEYQTQGGIFTTPGDAYTTPVEMWVKALDLLLEKLRKNWDLSKIKSIGGSAQHALVYWRSTSVPPLPSLSPSLPLHRHYPSSVFSLPATPTPSDASSHLHALYIQSLIGGKQAMVSRVGVAASPGLKAGELLRVRTGEGLNIGGADGENVGITSGVGEEVFKRTGRVQVASAFLGSLISGRWMPMREEEAIAMGMWVHQPQGAGGGHWDDQILEIVSGSREEGRRLRGLLGDVDVSGGGRKSGNVSRYLVDRYGFDPETIVTPFTSDTLSSYLSLIPSPLDAVLAFGPMDMMIASAHSYLPDSGYTILPHPAQDLTSEARKYVLVLNSRNADVARALVRDMYTKSWSAFDRLVAIVPPGGSIGLDDKLFSFFRLQAESYTLPTLPKPVPHYQPSQKSSRSTERGSEEPIKGIFRYETGTKVTEFRDLRANPRCLLESQILAFRVRWGVVRNMGVLTEPSAADQQRRAASTGSRGPSPIPPSPLAQSTHNPIDVRTPSASMASQYSSLGLPFDPYWPNPLPTRIIATGAAANFPSIVNLVGDVFNSPVYVPQAQVNAAQVAPFRNALTARAAVGGAWIARWVWGREKGNILERGLGFEEEARRTLAKKWAAKGASASSTEGSTGRAGLGVRMPSYSGGSIGRSSGLGNSVLVEADDEDEQARLEEMDEVGDIAVGVGRLSGFSANASTGSSAFGSPSLNRSLNGTGYNPGVIGGGSSANSSSGGGFSAYDRMRQNPSSPSPFGSNEGSGPSPSTAYTSPDANAGLSGVAGENDPAAAVASTGTTTLTPISALPTSDAETQLGWAKVAEADFDAFMAYASIVPEFCRLESGLARAGLN